MTSPLSQSHNRHRKVISTHRHKSVLLFLFGFGKLYFIFYSICLQSHNTRDQNIPACIYITYLLLSVISSLLCPRYCAGICELAPLRLSMASMTMNEGRITLFLTLSGRFFALKFYVQFTGAFGITGIEFISPKIYANSWHSAVFGGIWWCSVVFGGICIPGPP